MKIDFSSKMIHKGKNLKDEDGEDLKLYSPCVTALLAAYKDEEVEGKEKFKRYELAKKIDEKEEVDILVEEVSKIKELVGKAYGPLLVGLIYEKLEKIN